MFEDLSGRLESILEQYQAYEQPITDECQELLQFIIDLQQRLPHALHQAEQALPLAHSLEENYRARIQISTLKGLSQCANDTRLLLASFIPHAKSRAERYLNKRAALVNYLQALLLGLSALQPVSPLHKRVVRPDYLQPLAPNEPVEQPD